MDRNACRNILEGRNIQAADLYLTQRRKYILALADVERAQVPAIDIPVKKELDDQFSRAREAAKLNQHLHIFEGSDCQYLADLIVDVMRIPTMVKQGPFEDTTTGRELRTDELKRIAMLGQVDDDPEITDEALWREIGHHR